MCIQTSHSFWVWGLVFWVEIDHYFKRKMQLKTAKFYQRFATSNNHTNPKRSAAAYDMRKLSKLNAHRQSICLVYDKITANISPSTFKQIKFNSLKFAESFVNVKNIVSLEGFRENNKISQAERLLASPRGTEQKASQSFQAN